MVFTAIKLGALMPQMWRRPKFRESNSTENTPVADALSIMGTRMHAPSDIQSVYHMSDDLLTLHPELTMVGFSRAELEWAAAHGIMLTPRIHSAHRMARNFPKDISIAEEVKTACGDDLRRVPRPTCWHLVMRPSDQSDEDRALEEKPKSLALPVEPPSLSVFLAMAYADLKISGIPLLPGVSARYTREVISTRTGIRLRRVIVNGGVLEQPLIRVMTSHAHAPIRPALAWKPRAVTVA
jgi:hypothetical protein